jgi:hypothetical protein
VGVQELLDAAYFRERPDCRQRLERQMYGRKGGAARQITLEETMRICLPLLGSGERREALVLVDMYVKHTSRRGRAEVKEVMGEEKIGLLRALFQVGRVARVYVGIT